MAVDGFMSHVVTLAGGQTVEQLPGIGPIEARPFRLIVEQVGARRKGKPMLCNTSLGHLGCGVAVHHMPGFPISKAVLAQIVLSNCTSAKMI